MPNCTITNEEFILVMNSICKKEANSLVPIREVTSVEESLLETEMDSLTVMMFYVWILDMFGIEDNDETRSAVSANSTIAEIIDFIKKYQTRCYTFEEVKVEVNV